MNKNHQFINLQDLKEFLSGSKVSEINSLLLKAYENYMPHLVKFLISSNSNINLEAIVRDNKALIHLACKAGQDEVVKVLIANNANIEAKDNEQKTPLHLASESGQDEVVKVLIAKNANIHALEEHDRTSLHLAI